MKLSELLKEPQILIDFQAADKWAAIDALVEALVLQNRLEEKLRKPIIDALFAREKIASTGIEHGIALPHAWVNDVSEAHATLGLSRAGIPFQCTDGGPARLIILLVIPRQAVQQHSRTLAGIARLLGNGELRESLLKSSTPREALDIVREAEAKDS